MNVDAEDADKVTTDQPGQFEVDHFNNHEVTNQEVRPRRKAALRGEERRRLSDTLIVYKLIILNDQPWAVY